MSRNELEKRIYKFYVTINVMLGKNLKQNQTSSHYARLKSCKIRLRERDLVDVIHAELFVLFFLYS